MKHTEVKVKVPGVKRLRGAENQNLVGFDVSDVNEEIKFHLSASRRQKTWQEVVMK